MDSLWLTGVERRVSGSIAEGCGSLPTERAGLTYAKTPLPFLTRRSDDRAERRWTIDLIAASTVAMLARPDITLASTSQHVACGDIGRNACGDVRAEVTSALIHYGRARLDDLPSAAGS